jgi:hypothetical protein
MQQAPSGGRAEGEVIISSGRSKATRLLNALLTSQGAATLAQGQRRRSSDQNTGVNALTMIANGAQNVCLNYGNSYEAAAKRCSVGAMFRMNPRGLRLCAISGPGFEASQAGVA